MNFQPPDPDDFGNCVIDHRGIEKSEQSGGVCFECQMTSAGNEPAFPVGANEYGGHGTVFGVTVRDYFAAKAMQSLIANAGLDVSQRADVAEHAYGFADDMLIARAKS
jgi:hypothetical protein